MLSSPPTRSHSLLGRVTVRRVRQVLSITLAVHLTFIGIHLWVGPAELSEPTIYAALQLAVIVGGLVLLWRHPSLRVARRVGEIGMIVVIAMSTTSAVTAGDRNTVPILCVAIAMATGAFLPLGMWPQLRIAAVAALALVTNGFLRGDPLSGDPTVTALLGIGASVLAAREMNRNRTLVDASIASLREAEVRFDHLAASVPTVFWWLGPALDVRYISPAFERIWGRPVADACRSLRSVFETIHPDDRAQIVRAFQDMAEHGIDEEFRIVRPDGSVRRVHTRAYVTAAGGGAMPVITGMTEDVTDQRHVQGALLASRKRYADLFDNAPDAVLTFDGHGRLLTANPALERLLDRRAYDLAGRHFLFTGVIARSSRRTVVGIAKELAAHGTAPPAELELVCGCAGQVAVESNQRIVRGDGKSLEVEVILRDLTERRRAEEANRLRGLAAHLDSAQEHRRQQLARRLHDDLGQPLVALGLGLGWLSWALPSQLEEAKTRVSEMETLVTSMIAMVRKTMSELRPPVLDDFGLAAAVHWEAHDFREHTGIECVTHIDTDGARYTGDRAVAVFRTLQEALDNGAARGARHVHVHLDTTASMIAVSIEDDGQAVPTSSLPWDLVGMRERAHLLGGNFEVESPTAGGVKIRLRVPREPSKENLLS